MFPSLEQLRDADLGLGLAEPAYLVKDALDISEPELTGEYHDPYAQVTAHFQRLVTLGTQPVRLRFAKQQLTSRNTKAPPA